ncbi:hypothetical protein GC174_17825 [bacterium]|nr:hypothetical protein [bacterium]HMO24311.1 hypothetical protein [Candidatus Melainabacteria bacterium]HMP52920.1 hypothetical protein [Candidatus Melainabacteria bacterium]
MSLDARQDIDQVNRMVDNLLELADEALEDGSPIDPEQVKEMVLQIKELLIELFDNDFEGWDAGSGSSDEDDDGFFGEEEMAD